MKKILIALISTTIIIGVGILAWQYKKVTDLKIQVVTNERDAARDELKNIKDAEFTLPEEVRVPDVKGFPRSLAEKTLYEAGFQISYDFKNLPHSKDYVVNQAFAGKLLKRGTTINLVVGK